MFFYVAIEESSRTDYESADSDLCLVKVTYIASPGEFYVVRFKDEEKLDFITSALNDTFTLNDGKAAFYYPTPTQCISGQMYAVCDHGGNWNRGLCLSKCGFVDGKDKEILYDFFMLDQGHREKCIRSSTIRTLPSNIASIPAVAQECTLNSIDFQPVNWDVETVNYFTRLARQGPMEMKIFSQQDNVLTVDLAKLPNLVSVRDALLPQTPVVFFVSCESPDVIYLRTTEMKNKLETLKNEMAMHYNTATNNPKPKFEFNVGDRCAVLIRNRWWRAEVTCNAFSPDYGVHLLDLERLQTIKAKHMYPLEPKFDEYPPLTMRCSLDGVFPLSSAEWNYSVSDL